MLIFCFQPNTIVSGVSTGTELCGGQTGSWPPHLVKKIEHSLTHSLTPGLARDQSSVPPPPSPRLWPSSDHRRRLGLWSPPPRSPGRDPLMPKLRWAPGAASTRLPCSSPPARPWILPPRLVNLAPPIFGCKLRLYVCTPLMSSLIYRSLKCMKLLIKASISFSLFYSITVMFILLTETICDKY
jgi:hypothetical protein